MRAIVPAFLAVLAACDDAPPAPQNPAQLWLGLDGSELQVKLIDHEPKPY